MKKYMTPSVEEIKIVSMEHITDGAGDAGGDATGYGGTGRPGA